jgi:zinc and cadmium transporter
MTLLMIVLATLASGVLSVLLAASLTVTMLSRLVRHLVSLSAGVLLATALLHVLPEAFGGHDHAGHDHGHGHGPGAQVLFATLLGGLLFFWLLEKVELFRHVHHHEGDGHHHHHDFDAEQAGRGGYAVLVGDGVHNFCDGVIIAAAFLADPWLGAVTTLAVLLHEVPQEAGDFIVLLNAGFSRRRALLFNALSGLAAVAGGVAGYFLLEPWEVAMPYLLVVAASSFIYVALADLIPQLQQRLPWRETLAQVAWLAGGIGVVVLAMALLHEAKHVH